jgi:hypothetical protein
VAWLVASAAEREPGSPVVAAASIACSAAAAVASSVIWPAARQMTWAASNETRPAAIAWLVAVRRGSARPVATSSPARPGEFALHLVGKRGQVMTPIELIFEACHEDTTKRRTPARVGQLSGMGRTGRRLRRVRAEARPLAA